MKLARRMSRIGTESAFEVLRRARALEAQGRNIIHLEIGEPDFPTPKHIVEAGKAALDQGFTHYGPTQGLPEVRAAIAAYVSRTREIEVSPDRVCVVPGGKPMMFFPMMAVLEEGDEAIYPNPGFPIYESMIRFCGALPIPYSALHSGPLIDHILPKITSNTRLIVLNSPQNPTGGVIPAAGIRALADALRDRDILILSDEIYSRIWFGEKPLSIASMPGMLDQTILLDGFSKTYAMTGWRLGYGVLPEWLVEPVNLLIVNSTSCTASFTQRAGIAALEGPQDDVVKMVAEFRRRRDAFCAGLNTLPGFRCPIPEGAFYAFPNIEGTGRSSKELADALLNEAGVACLSGAAFGEYGEGYLRFSIANSFENLMDAVERIRAFLK
ncbi:MAG TPA: pyridoxal phosphate-dependent aminotransferase [Bryobacteraceae bacterium]|jgi:aspartate aminotransferase|nr:pyridoxal phosphate-dependent aminotransferase [Bryobacteraceae bacterium]